MVLFLFILGYFTLQVQDNLLKISQQDFPGIELEDSRVFNGNALWGYINGGADIYLEYGFDKLLAHKLKYEGRQYVVDIYKMNNPESAFGIFSVSFLRCDEKLTDTSISCVTPYQVQFVQGSYYISIVNENGSSAEQKLCKKFANILKSKINETSFTFPDLFKKEEFLPYYDKIKRIKGRLGLENGFPQWASYFENLEDFILTLMPVESDDHKIYIAEVEFSNDDSMKAFLVNMHLDPGQIKNSPLFIREDKMYIKKVEDKKLVIIESTDDSSLINKFIKILELE